MGHGSRLGPLMMPWLFKALIATTPRYTSRSTEARDSCRAAAEWVLSMRFATGCQLLAATVILALLHVGGAAAQGGPSQAAPAPKAPAQRPAMPSPEALIMLIRTTLVAVHQGNVTGNYTVLRDIAAPGFQAANSAAQLAQIFASLRTQRVDLSPTVLVTPELVQGPVIGEDGMLRLAGAFQTDQLRINFQLMFQVIDGQWRVFGVGINPTPVSKEGATDAAPAAVKSQPAAKSTQTPPMKPAAKQPSAGVKSN